MSACSRIGRRSKDFAHSEIMLVIISLMGTRFSAKPFMDIIRTLEGSRNIPVPEETRTTDQQHTLSGHNLKSGFEYISRSILSADIRHACHFLLLYLFILIFSIIMKV